jgi:hypothetical protein
VSDDPKKISKEGIARRVRESKEIPIRGELTRITKLNCARCKKNIAKTNN